jgi:quercetin dioxygenase-like cupin family protein
MKHHHTRVLIASVTATVALAAAAAALLVVPALATPPSGVSNPPWSPVIGRFNDINATATTDIDPGRATDFWRIRIKADDPTDVHIVENVIHPGGTFGWHSHPGPSLVVVKAGTLSVYHPPDCTPQDFGPASALGSTFVDDGHDLHMVRNNGTVDADVYVVSFVPAGFPRRIDEPNPNPTICPN